MKVAHRGTGITDAQVGALVENLVKTLNRFNVPCLSQGDPLATTTPKRAA